VRFARSRTRCCTPQTSVNIRLEPWVKHARELSASADDLATVGLLGCVARYDFERAAYSLARSCYQQELDTRKRVQGEEHPDTLTSMNNLAGTLGKQGDLPGAKRLQEAVLETRKRVLGEEHPDALTSMGNLGLTLWKQGDLHGARRLQEAVLETMKHVLGEEHPDTLTSMNNLAITLWNQGETAGARRLQEASVRGRLRALGAQHPNTLQGMQTLKQMGGASPKRADGPPLLSRVVGLCGRWFRRAPARGSAQASPPGHPPPGARRSATRLG
jgi:hypothetical protein